MRVEVSSKSIAQFEKTLLIYDYITASNLIRQATIWREAKSTSEEFTSWVKNVVVKEYLYTLNLDAPEGERFTILGIKLSEFEEFLLDSVWYG